MGPTRAPLRHTIPRYTSTETCCHQMKSKLSTSIAPYDDVMFCDMIDRQKLVSFDSAESFVSFAC